MNELKEELLSIEDTEFNIDDTMTLAVYLGETNDIKYNWSKLAEELIELADVSLKMANKTIEKQPTLELFVEEAGDVNLRLLAILSTLPDQVEDLIEQRMIDKSKKLISFMRNNKYTGGI